MVISYSPIAWLEDGRHRGGLPQWLAPVPASPLKDFPGGDTSLSLGLSHRRRPQVAIPITISILSGLLSTPGLMRADRSLSEPMVKGTTFRVQGVLEIAYPG